MIKDKNILQQIFTSFRNGLLAGRTTKAKKFVTDLGIEFTQFEIGYNSGQFHHRKDDKFKQPFLEAGILTLSDAPVNDPSRTAYTIFGKESIILPLKDMDGTIVNFYAHSIKVTPKQDYFNEQGVYPCFPDKKTTKLYLCVNMIDTASFIQAGIMENRDAVLALRDGENTPCTVSAICSIDNLQEIVIIGKVGEDYLKEFDGVSKLPTPTVIDLPEGHSLNDMWVSYGAEGIQNHIDEKLDAIQDSEVLQENNLVVVSNSEFHYQGYELSYKITGAIPENATLLEMQFEIHNNSKNDVLRVTLNLLDSNQVKETLFNWSEDKNFNYAKVILELNFITEELEKLRRLQNQGEKLTSKGFSTSLDKQAKKLLQSKDLFQQLNDLIGEAGIVGEQQTRLLLFMVASSYKFEYNLHAVVQANVIETGSELVSKIAELIPEMDRYEIDLTTSRTFRYYGNSVINEKLLVIPDYYGVTSSKAIKDLKRLQAKGTIVNDAPKKTRDGVLATTKLEVKGHTSSIGACTTSKRYFEAQPKTVLVGMDQSDEQLEKLMLYDCMVMSGTVDSKKESQAMELLHYVIKNIHALKVVNGYASSMMLPTSIPNARMLTMQLFNFVSIVTLFKQHQRKKDNQGRVIVQKEDVRSAIDLFLDAIMVNIDELDATTRAFFDRYKMLMNAHPKGKNGALNSLEIRQLLQMSKSTVNRLLRILVEFEYIKVQGHKNTGFTYKITNWNELGAIKKMIKTKLGELGDSA